MRNRSLLVALLALLAVPFAMPADSGAAASAKAKGKRLVVSPRPGQVVHSHRVRLRVRSRTLTDTLRVRLNGTRIGEDFAPPRRGKRTLRASLSHGLRRGRNVLRVTVRSRGGAVRTTRVRFVVRTRHHLVGAGRDRELAINGKVQIRGAVRTAPRGDAGAKLRWKLIRAPRLSPAHDALLGGAAPLTLTSPGGKSAAIRPRVPGRYTLRLSAGGGSRAASDTVTFEATPRGRLVPIDTMTAMDAANGDQRGIRVGEITYLLRDARGYESPDKSFRQVLVLDRSTLELVSNTTDIDILRSGAAGLDQSKLVIFVLQPGQNDDVSSLGDLLGPIGGPDVDKWVAPGELSAIGVPGMDRGDADIYTTVRETGVGRVNARRPAPLKGYLTPDQYGEFGFVPKARMPVSFGPKSSAPPPAPNTAGFRLRHLDPYTLAPAGDDGVFYPTFSDPAEAEAQAIHMAYALEQIPPDDVVMIEAVSSRGSNDPQYRPPIGRISRGSAGRSGSGMTRLANAIATVGGSRDAFNRIALQPGSLASGGMTYALVGWKDAGEGAGAEVAAGVDGEGDAPSLSVMLRPDRESRFRPVEESGAPDALTDLVMEEPTTKWPLDDEPRAKAALTWLAAEKSQKKLSSDPRADYRSQLLDQAGWDGIADVIKIVAYTEVPDDKRNDFTEAEFLKARAQLVKELRWVGNVRSYLSILSSPVSGSEVLNYATVKQVASTVHDEAKPPDNKSTMRWLEFTEILLELAGPITHEVSSTIAGVMELGTWMFGADEEGGPIEEIPFKADEFGADLVKEMQASVARYYRMGDVIVTDPAKLAFVGENGACSSNSETCPRGWSFNEDDQTRVKSDLKRSVERMAWQELLPLAFTVYGLNTQRRAGPPDPRWYNCHTYPFYYFSDTAVSHATTALQWELDPQNAKGQLWKTLVLAKPGGQQAMQHAQPPSDKTLRRVFGPVAKSTSPDEGGLAVSLARLLPAHEWKFWSPTPWYKPTQDACS
jgi:hypothetical protein